MFLPGLGAVRVFAADVGLGQPVGRDLLILQSLVHSIDKEKRLGGSNRTMYANPKLDSQIQTAITTVDDEKRKVAAGRRMEMAIGDYATSRW